MVVCILDDEIRRRVAQPRLHAFMQRIARDHVRRDLDSIGAQRIGETVEQCLQTVA